MGTIGWDDITRPSPFGNRFSFGGAPYPSCINMVAENLEKLVKNGTLLGGAVQVKLYEDLTNNGRHYAIVTDERIPSRDWFRSDPRILIVEADLVADMEKTLAELDARYPVAEQKPEEPAETIPESIIVSPYEPGRVYEDGELFTYPIIRTR